MTKFKRVWKYQLDLRELYLDPSLTTQDKARKIGQLIEDSDFYKDEWTFAISDVVDQFSDLAGGYNAEGGFTEEKIFDDIMRELNDYASKYNVQIWKV